MASEYSFENDTLKTQFQQHEELERHANTIFNETNLSHQEDESLWDNHKDDSHEFSTHPLIQSRGPAPR